MKATESLPQIIQPGAYKLPGAAAYLGGLNLETVRRLVKRGLLKPCRGTRHMLFSKVELDRFLAS